MARHALVKHRSKRKQITPSVNLATRRLLWRKVEWRSNNHFAAGPSREQRFRILIRRVRLFFIQLLRQAEVQNFDLTSLGHDDIRGLDIAMYDPMRMCLSQRCCDGFGNLN